MKRNPFSDRILLIDRLSAMAHSEGPISQPADDRALLSYLRGHKLADRGYDHVFTSTAAQLEDMISGRLDDLPGRYRQKEYYLQRLCPPGLESLVYARQLVDILYCAESILPPPIDDLPLSMDERDLIFPQLEQFGSHLYSRIDEPSAVVVEEWIRGSEPCRDQLSVLVGEIARVQAMYPDPDELDETLTDWYLHRPEDPWSVWLPRTAEYFTTHIREHHQQRKAERNRGKEPQ